MARARLSKVDAQALKARLCHGAGVTPELQVSRKVLQVGTLCMCEPDMKPWV